MGASMRPVDNLWTTRRNPASNGVDNFNRLTGLLPSSSASERVCADSSLRRLVVWGGLCLSMALLALQAQPAQAMTKSVDHYKLYAHSRIINYEQYKCLSKIIYKESRWNPQAKNGSHFGLGQMRSEHYRTLDAYRQIDATIKYITLRYGSMCNALRFHLKNGYF